MLYYTLICIHLLNRNVLCISSVPGMVVNTGDRGVTDRVPMFIPPIVYSRISYLGNMHWHSGPDNFFVVGKGISPRCFRCLAASLISAPFSQCDNHKYLDIVKCPLGGKIRLRTPGLVVAKEMRRLLIWNMLGIKVPLVNRKLGKGIESDPKGSVALDWVFRGDLYSKLTLKRTEWDECWMCVCLGEEFSYEREQLERGPWGGSVLAVFKER